ncbi:hypothetical protein LBMAG53_11290 [Planctomycetota bacterium]|nr:hypothetical protein LBMAG53_11290 [Planctomycetota bacterium]
MNLRFLVIIAAGLGAGHAPLVGVEPGDPGVTATPEHFLGDFPAMARWAAAGVSGGIPAPAVRATVAPGADLAAAVAGGSGVVVLAAGTWVIDKTLTVPAGVVIRGAGPQTTLALAGSAEIRFDQVAKSGLERLRVIHQGAATWLAANPPQLLTMVGPEDPSSAPSPPGTTYRFPKLKLVSCNDPAVPAGHALVRLGGASDCWLDQVRLESAADTPLAIVNSSRLTFRQVAMDGTARPGTGSGIARLHGISDSLFYRCDVRDLRQIRLSGASAGNVILASAFAAPWYFTDSSQVTDNLFEANVHLIPPGSPWRSFAFGHDPIGPGNVLLDSRGYAQGTEALIPKVANVTGTALGFSAFPQRFVYNTETDTWEMVRLCHRLFRPDATPTAGSASAPPSGGTASGAAASGGTASGATAPIDPPAGPSPADAGPLIQVNPGAPILSFVYAVAPLAEGAVQAPTEWPRIGGSLGGATALASVPSTNPRNGAVDVLGLAGADRKQVWLGGVLELPVAATVIPEIGGTAKSVWFISGKALVHGEPISLAAGKHPLWGSAAVVKANPFVKRLESRLTFTLSASRALVATSAKAPVPVPDPPKGTLYATTATVDRSGLAAYADVLKVHKLLASAEPEGLDAALEALATSQADRLGGWLARRWQDTIRPIEAVAATQPDELKRWQYRSSAYFLAGLPQRAWAFEKLLKERFPGAPEDQPERVLP